MAQKQIEVKIGIPTYDYLYYLEDAVEKGVDFKYSTIYQIGARFSGKTGAGSIAVIRAIIEAGRQKTRLVVYLFRMRHKDVKSSVGSEILSGLGKYHVPYRTNWSKGEIKALSSTIYCKGCYMTDSTQISLIGLAGNYRYSHCIVVLEEAFEFDPKTYSALKEAIRGVDRITGILRTNPGLASNGLLQRCFSTVPLDERVMIDGTGNIFQEVGRDAYHYMRGDVNTLLPQTQRDYLEEVKINNPLRARTVYYGLPGAYEGMVFAEIVHKIKTKFEFKRGDEFTAGVDVGHVSSAMTASLGALDYNSVGKVGEYYHSNKEEKYMESIELAQAILKFYQEGKDKFKFQELDCHVDSADQGFISLLNTEALRQGKHWFYARSCKKIEVRHRISWYTTVINKEQVGILSSCTKTLAELKMLAYDEKAEDDRVKLVKQNDHTGDADMYALTPYMKRYIDYDLI